MRHTKSPLTRHHRTSAAETGWHARLRQGSDCQPEIEAGERGGGGVLTGTMPCHGRQLALAAAQWARSQSLDECYPALRLSPLKPRQSHQLPLHCRSNMPAFSGFAGATFGSQSSDLVWRWRAAMLGILTNWQGQRS